MFLRQVVLVLTAVASLAAVQAADSVPPQPLDPLTAAERQRLGQTMQRERQRIIERRPQVQSRITAETLVRAPAAPQLLLLERRHDKSITGRRADAYYYDYANDETTHLVISLTTGAILSVDLMTGTQLPLIEAEVTRAFDVLLANPRERRSLAQAFSEITGEAFVDRSQLKFKAFVFHPDTVADGLVAAARNCGVHRCAQLLIYTHDNVALDLSPIIDLSRARVLQNLELRARSLALRETLQ